MLGADQETQQRLILLLTPQMCVFTVQVAVRRLWELLPPEELSDR